MDRMRFGRHVRPTEGLTECLLYALQVRFFDDLSETLIFIITDTQMQILNISEIEVNINE